MQVYHFDGSKIKDFDTFLIEFGKMINGENGYFGKTFHAFDDCLFGGYGLIYPCVIIWKNSNHSKEILNHDALIKNYQHRIDRGDYYDQEGLDYLKSSIENARNKKGPTLFDFIVDSINSVPERSKFKLNIELKLC